MNEVLILLMTMNVSHVHLSFDDGPDPKYTREVLSILKENQLQANFFLVGQKVNENKNLVKRMVREGHDIGGHSMTHKELTKIPFEQAKEEILNSMEVVNKFQKTNLFRFPYGSFNPKLVQVLQDHGYRNIYWDVDTTDWKYKDKDVIYKKFKLRIAKAKDGSIILMHDIHPQSVQSLKMIVEYLKSNKIKVTKLDYKTGDQNGK